MTESNWTQEAEPAERGTVTKTVPPQPTPAPPVSDDDKLKAGIAALGKAAHDARQGHDAEVEKVRRSLAPVLKEAAGLQRRLKDRTPAKAPRRKGAVGWP